MTEIGKDSPATIRVRFVTEDDLVSALIRERTWCEYSHVEFVLDDGTTLGAHFNGGVRVRPADYAKFTRIAELVAAAFEQAVPLLNVDEGVNRIVPRDLLLSLRLRACGGLIPMSGTV